MPRSRLDGREPAQVTEYQYDDAGRLARAVTTREPEWTERDHAELLALALYRTWLCPCGCGLLAEDTLSHEATGPAFHASRTRCRARDALILQQDALPDNVQRPGALLWSIEKR